MKRVLVLLVVIVMSLGLCACGGSGDASSENTSADSASTESGNNEVAFDEGTVVVENDDIKVELVNFYEKETDGDLTDKCLTLKVTNKGEVGFLFNMGDVYIGEDAFTAVMYDGNEGPIPGKSKTYKYKITHNDDDYTPIDSLEQLYELDGTVEVSLYDESGDVIVDDFEEYFSFKEMGLE